MNDNRIPNFLKGMNTTNNPNAMRDFAEAARKTAELNRKKGKSGDSLCSNLGYACIGVLLALIILTPIAGVILAYSVFAHGFVAMKLWAWFVIPVFGVKAITWLQAAGIMLLVRLFTYTLNTNKDADEKITTKTWVNIITALILPWVTLLIGYVIHRLM